MFVRLKKKWPGSFRRTVRDEKGEAVSVLEWSPDDPEPMEITDPLELNAIAGDLGKALEEVKPRITVPDKTPEATEAKAAEEPAKPKSPSVKRESQPAVKTPDPLKV